jgi:uncharacterized membrane protein YphA (DoxX/SURF4 family)
VPGLRIATALVWFVFGLGFKILGLVPRHRMIVAAIAGESLADPLTYVVGAAEVAIGIWILSGAWPRLCATVQTIAIAAMNAVELTLARELLLAPIPMVCANAAFLAVGWYCALARRRT